MSNTVSVPMIVKNEVSNLPSLLDILCPILEEVIIVDTGSTDGTIEAVKQKQSVYPNLRLEHFKWIKDFAAARNYSFSLASNVEWLLFLDGDDRVDPVKLKNFKENILINPNVDCWTLDYIYSQFPDGSPQTILGRERFLRRSKNPQWRGSVHECVDLSNFRTQHHYDLKVVHNRHGKFIDPNRNVEILESEYAKNPHDARTAYYYGKELFDRINPKGIEVLQKFIDSGQGWYDDRVNALHRVGRDHLVKKRHREAIRCAEEIYHADFSRRRSEGYWIYGAVEMDLGNYEIAIEWFKRCLITPPEAPRVLSLEYFTWNPCKQITECYKILGRYQEMLEYRLKTLKHLPGDREMERWAEHILLELGQKENFKVLEVMVPETQHDPKATALERFGVKNLEFGLPFKSQSLDKVVLGPDAQIEFKEVARVLKPNGILVTLKEISHELFNCFVAINAKEGVSRHSMWGYAKVNKSLPSFCFRPGDRNYGPYRIQVDNLIRSVVRNGHPIRSDGPDVDFYVGQVLSPGIQAKTKVLMLTEWLPDSDYAYQRLDLADVVLTSSIRLAQNMKTKFPNKAVAPLVDHFELPGYSWLNDH